MLVTAVITGEYIEEAQPKYAGYRCDHCRLSQDMLVTAVVTGEYIEEARLLKLQPAYDNIHWKM